MTATNDKESKRERHRKRMAREKREAETHRTVRLILSKRYRPKVIPYEVKSRE